MGGSKESKRSSTSFAPICMRTVNRSGHTPKHTGRRAYFDRPCGVPRQSIDQLALVQEATNEMEPSRSPVLASRENLDYQRATGPVRASFSTGGYRRLTPRFLRVSILLESTPGLPCYRILRRRSDRCQRSLICRRKWRSFRQWRGCP